MADSRTLKVEVIGDASSAQAAFRKLGDESVSLNKKMADIGAKMSTRVTLPIVAGLGYATKAASDLSEQVNKTNRVFGESSKEIHAFTKNSAQSLGQSQRAALEYAGTFGNLFRAIGLTTDQSASFSKRLLTLTADLASFNNAAPDEVFAALKSGLVGETEPLKRFGVNLNEARLQQEALNLGLTNGRGPLDAAAKAQAAYSLILKDTTLAQGDFANTADGAANKSRIVKAAVEDAAAGFGKVLLPAAEVALGGINDLLGGLQKMPSAVQAAVVGFAGVAAAAGPALYLAGNVGILRQKLVDLGPTGVKANTALGFLGKASGYAVGAYAIAEGVGLLANKIDEAARGAPNLGKLTGELNKLGKTGGSAEKVLKAARTNVDSLNKSINALERFGGPKPGLLDQVFGGLAGGSADAALAEANRQFKDLDKSLSALARGGASKQAADNLSAVADALGRKPELLKNYLPEYTKTLDENTAAGNINAAAQKEQASKTKEAGDAASAAASQYQKITDAVSKTRDAIDATIQPTLDLSSAESSYFEAADAVRLANVQGKDAFNLRTEAGRKNREMLDQLVQSTADYVDQRAIANGSDLTEIDTRMQQIRLLEEQAQTATPAVREEIRKYIDMIDGVPDGKTTNLYVQAEDAKRKLIEFRQELQGLLTDAMNALPFFHASTFALAPAAVSTRSAAQRRAAASRGLMKAAGGPVVEGQPYIVGERGQELFVPDSDGTIVPNHRLNSGAASRTAAMERPVVNNYVTFEIRGSVIHERELGDIVHRALLDKERGNGYLWAWDSSTKRRGT